MGQDTKRLITGMVVALGVIIAYQWTLHHFWPGNWEQAQQNPPAATQVASTQTATTTQATTGPSAPTTAGSTGGVTTAPTAATWRARGDERAAEPKTIGSIVQQDKNFAMAVEVFAKGAAINSVTLNEFRKTAEDTHTPYVFQEPYQV